MSAQFKQPFAASRRSDRGRPQVELHCHSAYSFGDGASSPAELASAAAELGIEAIALTDHDNVCGAMEFAHACRGVGVRPIFGAELTIELPTAPGAGGAPRAGGAGLGTGSAPSHRRAESGDRTRASETDVLGHVTRAPENHGHVTLLVESAAGWRNLCLLLTEAHRGTRPKPGRDPLSPSLPLESLEVHAEGLVCLSGCARDGALAGRWERGEPRRAESLGRRLVAAFGPDRFRVELQRPLWRHDRARNRWLSSLAERLGVAAVATGNVHAHTHSRSTLQDALVAARLGATLEETESRRRGNSAAVLQSGADIRERFADHPAAIAESTLLAERFDFDLTGQLGYTYPGADDEYANRRLAELCRSRLEDRYRVGAPSSSGSQGSALGTAGAPAPGAPVSAGERSEAERRLEQELRLIRDLRLSGFFELHHDMLELAREVAVEVRGGDAARSLLPPGRGRGSSVSSIVCYLTGLSHIDPIRNGLFLGRFLNDGLTDAPDIDLDFPRDIRERLIPRIHERYGHRRSALVAAFATYRPRGAVRDLGKALGLPQGEIERLARAIDVYEPGSEIGELIETLLGPRSRSPRWKALAELLPELCGLPRHISQHPGGMVISTRPLDELCPLQPAAMEGRQIVQWEKDSCADAGFLKIDLLGLGMLSAVERCVSEIARSRGEPIDLSRVPLDDPACWRAIQRAETTGVFQIESRAQMQMLPRTLPENLDDLTVQVALVRPGPIQGGAVHPYIERRRRRREDPSYEVPYEHPSLEPVLRDTLGAIVFQDQVLEVSIALAGFTAGEAEKLRRAMSRRRSEAAILRYRRRFIEGAVERGVPREVAERVFSAIEGFSGFGFPKAHSAAFGLLAYQSTWLRVHYGPEFLCALLNEQPMGFYPPDALVHEAQRRGIEVLGPDVNASALECRVETAGADPGTDGLPPVRIGLGYVAEVEQADVVAMIAERGRGGAYRSIADLAGRSGASRAALERFAWAGACDRLVGGRSLVAEPSSDLPDGRCPAPDRSGMRYQAPDQSDARCPAPTKSKAATDPSIADALAIAEGARRRPALWEAGAATGAATGPNGIQLALALDSAPAPELPAPAPWERVLADYRTIGMTLADHPMELMRGQLGSGYVASRDLAGIRDRAPVEVAGMVVARQRPATAKGVVFMLLEDEWGMVNLIVPPPVARRFRLVLRTAGFVVAGGRLEHREGTTNVLVSTLSSLHTPNGRLPGSEPPATGLSNTRTGAVAAAANLERQTRGLTPAGARSLAPTLGHPLSPAAAGSGSPAEAPNGALPPAAIQEQPAPPGDIARRTAIAELAAALPPRQHFGRRGR